MQRRSFLLLVAVAVVMALAAVVVVSRGDRDVSRAPTDQRALPGFADKLGTLAFFRSFLRKRESMGGRDGWVPAFGDERI